MGVWRHLGGRSGLSAVLGGLLIALFLFSSGATSAPVEHAGAGHFVGLTLPPARYTVAFTPDVAYGPLPAERLDLCVPLQAVSPRPGIVLIHGGGWLTGDKRDMDDTCRYLAGQGYDAVSLGYRLSTVAPWPAQLVDVQLAVRWLRVRATTVSLDPARLCSYGFSAGGQLAVWLGVQHAPHVGNTADLYPNEDAGVRCVVDIAGPIDELSWISTSSGRDYLRHLLPGMSPTNAAMLLAGVSPLGFVTPASAPMFILQGTHDTIVPPSQSLALFGALERQHVAVRYDAFDGGHGLGSVPLDEAESIEATILGFLNAQLRQ